MRPTPRAIAIALVATLAWTTYGCAGQQAAETPAADQAAAGSQKTFTSAQSAFELDAGTYRMLTLNGEDTQPAVDEYLDSGYQEAAYQLVLYPDGNGLLYDGRSFHAALLDGQTLGIEGLPAELSSSEGRFALVWQNNTLVFDAQPGPVGARATTPALAGTYTDRDQEGAVGARLRLREDGSGTYQSTEGAAKSPVSWGTDPVFGRDYVAIAGVSHELSYTRQSGEDGVSYTLTIDGSQTLRTK